MTPLIRTLGFCFVATLGMMAAVKRNPLPANVAEVSVSTEVVPAGGTVQVKFSLTEPRPIGSTGASFFADAMAVDGIALWSPSGDAAGIGLLRNGWLKFAAISPTASIGAAVDYPFLTITMDLPKTMKAGNYPLSLGSDSWLNAVTGPLTLITKPGQLTVGGSLSIHDVIPGGGTWPAGTTVRIIGTGFSPSTAVRSKLKLNTVRYVSPQEIQVTLKSASTLDAQPFDVTNPDRSTATYFAYLRGVYLQAPSRSILKSAEPAFQQLTHGIATVGPVAAQGPGQFTALALQNPNPGPVVVTLELDRANGSRRFHPILMPSGTRVMDEIGAFFGTTLAQGDTIRLISTAPVQILGITGDDIAGTLAPFLPQF